MSNEAETSQPNMAERMPALAAEFVQTCKTAGIALDYQPRTLGLVDRFLNGTRQAAVAPAVNEQDPMPITAYLGEVIVRETGASWYEFEDRPFLNLGDYQADPLTVVTGLLAHGQGQEGDLTIESTKAYCDMICKMQRLWLDGTVMGSYESMGALRTSMTPDAKLAGTLVAQAQGAVKTAKMQWQESLDFSDDSLDAIERILSALHNRSMKTPPDPLTEEEIATASKMWGVYVGEVVRRYYGGQWATSADGVLQINLSGTSPQPIVKVRKRIVHGPSDNIRFFFASIAKALSS
jgi:hypothetical protein